MPERYFDKFPTITYANNQALDITERVIFTDNTLKNPYIYYLYDLNNGQRADQFAYDYYSDPYYTWLIYLSTQTLDPYYEWYMSQDDFNSFIEKKYGSTELAMAKTKFYRNNWPTQNPIAINDYENLAPETKKYWEPQYTLNGSILDYVRKQVDTVVNTNNIRAYQVGNTSFVKDEICTINFDYYHTGLGQVLFANNGYVYLQHTSGTTLGNTTVLITGSSYIHGNESGVNTVFTSASSYANNLLPEEAVYYSPVTYYDYEREKNELNKSIRVVASPYAKTVAKTLKGLLK